MTKDTSAIHCSGDEDDTRSAKGIIHDGRTAREREAVHILRSRRSQRLSLTEGPIAMTWE